jgi:hypothetical protein
VTLADDNKRAGGGWQATWHFDDHPLIGDNSKASDINITYDNHNISMAMPDIYNWLSGEDVNETYTYQTIMKHVGNEEEGQSLALRLLIHYYGDIHQPLHNENRYTKELPHGDKGGNMFPLHNHDGAKELHAVWDKVIYAYHKNPPRPFTKDSWAMQGAMALDLFDQFKFTPKQYETTDFKLFSQEAFDIAEHAYDGLIPGKNETVPDAYIEKYQPIAKEQAVLAAYRLTYGMQQLFGAKISPVEMSANPEPYQMVKDLIMSNLFFQN